MRTPPVTFDALLAALAVLSTGAAACSKADRARAEPATLPGMTATAIPQTTSSAAPSSALPEPAAQATAAAAASPAAPPPKPGTAEKQPATIDAGIERTPRNPTKGASAACGATGCSAEMRKGK